jgi:hypothetical protein
VQRTALKRKQVLLEIDPKLPHEHAPEISSVIKDEASARQEKRNDFLLPYVNLEDLSINNGTQCKCLPLARVWFDRQSAVLGLLHARALRFPSEFAWFDSNTVSPPCCFMQGLVPQCELARVWRRSGWSGTISRF